MNIRLSPTLRRLAVAAALAALAIAPLALAQQVYNVSGPGAVYVENPFLRMQYNGQLDGDPAVYQFETTSTARLALQVAQRAEAGLKKDVSAALVNPADDTEPLLLLKAEDASWTETFFEPKASTTYLLGPTGSRELSPGKYEIRAWSSNNDAPYTLIFGTAADAPAEPGLLNTPPIEDEGPSLPLLIGVGMIAIILGTILARRRRMRVEKGEAKLQK